MRISKSIICIIGAIIWSIDGATAAPIRLHLQVNDVHGKPIPNVGITVAGHGISGPNTSRQGSTRISLPPNVELADPVTIQLDAETSSRFVFIQPWDGMITVPKPKAHTLVVLANPGDRHILETGVGVMAVLSKIDKEISEVRKTSKSNTRLIETLKKTTQAYGFTPKEVESAVKKRELVTVDPKEKAVIASYSADIATLLATLDEIPDYSKKQKKLEKLIELNNKLSQAVGIYVQSIPGFQAVQSGFQVQPDKSTAGNSIGVRNAVESEISVWPRFFITLDDDEQVIIRAQDDELLRGSYAELKQEQIDASVRNYFTPRIQKATSEFADKHKQK